MKLWDLTALEILNLPDDALGLLVLEAFGVNGWNVDSFFKGSAQSHPVFNQDGVANRVADGWAWLEAHGLIGPSLSRAAARTRGASLVPGVRCSR